jgi:hypothetical protein
MQQEANMAAAPVPPASVPAAEPAPLSEGARIINTFIAPSKTFTDLRRNASWWGPWLLICIVSIIFVYAIDRQISFEQVSRNEIAHSARAEQFDKLSPDDQAKQIRFTVALIRYLSYGTPVTILLYFAIGAVVLWATFNFGAGANVPFKTAYAIMFYGVLPSVIASILGTISMFAGVDPEGFNVKNPVATNPAYFMDRAGNKFVYEMASSLDVIAIWSIVLLGIGFACNSKVKRSTAIAIVAGWYLFWKLASAALASLG